MRLLLAKVEAASRELVGQAEDASRRREGAFLVADTSRRALLARCDQRAASAASHRFGALVRNLVATPGPWQGAARSHPGSTAGDDEVDDGGGGGSNEDKRKESRGKGNTGTRTARENRRFTKIYTPFWSLDPRTDAGGAHRSLRRNYDGSRRLDAQLPQSDDDDDDDDDDDEDGANITGAPPAGDRGLTVDRDGDAADGNGDGDSASSAGNQHQSLDASTLSSASMLATSTMLVHPRLSITSKEGDAAAQDAAAASSDLAAENECREDTNNGGQDSNAPGSSKSDGEDGGEHSEIGEPPMKEGGEGPSSVIEKNQTGSEEQTEASDAAEDAAVAGATPSDAADSSVLPPPPSMPAPAKAVAAPVRASQVPPPTPPPPPPAPPLASLESSGEWDLVVDMRRVAGHPFERILFAAEASLISGCRVVPGGK